MNILVCTDVFYNGGLETNIITNTEYLLSQGHKVFLCTDSISKDYIQNTGKLFTDLFLIKDLRNTNWEDLLEVSKRIQTVIKENSIDKIIIHPFTSQKFCVHAAISSGTPYFLYFHGPASVNVYDGSLIDELWMSSIALQYSSQTICVSQESYDALKEKYPTRIDSSTVIIPNPVKNFAKKSDQNISERYILFASRIDGDKYHSITEAVNFFKEKFLEKEDSISLYIAGDGSEIEKLQQYIVEQGVEHRVRLLGFLNYEEMGGYIYNAEFVIGMGRVCLESLISKKHVLLSGYDGLKGFVRMSNIKEFAEKNFSGRGMEIIPNNLIFEEYISLFEDKNNKKEITELAKYVSENYSVKYLGGILDKYLTSSPDPSIELFERAEKEANMIVSYAEVERLKEENSVLLEEHQKLNKDLPQLKEEQNKLYEDFIQLKEEHDNIISSKGWKTVVKLRELRDKLQG